MLDFKDHIRSIPDFPQAGVLFRDITTVLQDKDLLKASIDSINDSIKDLDYDLILGPESRGFIFGVPVAYASNKGFVPVRKIGKLPYETLQKSYDLEYGSATIEIHKDAIKKGQKIVIVDDLLATGGTCKAICELVEEAGGIVAGIVFFIELDFLNGRDVLKGYDVRSIVKY